VLQHIRFCFEVKVDKPEYTNFFKVLLVGICMVGEYFGINEHAAKQLDNDYHMGFWDSVGFPVGFAASEGGVVIMTQHDKPVTLEEKS